MKPQSIELDMLIGAMIERTLKDGALAWECLKRLHGVLEKEFDLKHKLELKEGYGGADHRASADKQFRVLFAPVYERLNHCSV